DELFHHGAHLRGLCGGQVLLLKGIVLQVEELVVGAAGNLRGEVVVDDLPVPFPQAAPVGSAVRGVRVVHEEALRAGGIARAGKQGGQRAAVHSVGGGVFHTGHGEQRGEDVHDSGLLALDGTGGD